MGRYEVQGEGATRGHQLIVDSMPECIYDLLIVQPHGLAGGESPLFGHPLEAVHHGRVGPGEGEEHVVQYVYLYVQQAPLPRSPGVDLGLSILPGWEPDTPRFIVARLRAHHCLGFVGDVIRICHNLGLFRDHGHVNHLLRQWHPGC